jgi:hypothetical protein
MNRKLQKLNGRALKRYAKTASEMAAGALSSIHAAADIGRRSSLTAGEQKRLAPTKIDKMEARISKMLAGWSIVDIECLLVHRVIPEAKRRATVPR